MKILLVDDDEFVRALITEQLKNEDFVITQESNVDNAITLLDSQSFDLLITDIMMPNKDGGDLMRYVKQQGLSMPILAITGGIENAQEDYQHYADMFADKTLVKPVSQEDLLSAIKELCS